MAAFDGRDVIVKLKHGATLSRVCAKTKTFTIGGEPIDVTQDCDDGFRKLLITNGTRSLDIAVEGLMENGDLLGALTDPAATTFQFDGEVTFPGLWVIAGKFNITGFSAGAEVGAATTVSFTMQSSGAWTRVAAT